jgi:hypothetical protein
MDTTKEDLRKLTKTSWGAAKTRVRNKNQKTWHHYGGRGIKMCERWLASFDDFVEDVGLRPSKKHSIDRIDGDGHYSCGKCNQCVANGWQFNCRWSTQREQTANFSRNIKVEIDGQNRLVSHWFSSPKVAVKQTSYNRRLKRGMSPYEALTTPAPQARQFVFRGESKTLAQWCEVYGVKYITAHARMTRMGMTLEQALTTPVAKRRRAK